MDWSKVELPDPKERSPRSGKLSNLDYYKLLVASKILRKSLMAVIQTAILTYLSRNWGDHEQRLTVEAKQRGIGVEELFSKLANGEIEL